MKKITFLSCLLLISTSLLNAQTNIKGLIKNSKKNEVEMSGFIDYGYEIYQASIDKKGQFNLEIPLKYPTLINFENQTIFIRPGDELSINFDEKDLKNTFKVIGGDEQANIFLKEWYATFSDIEEFRVVVTKKDPMEVKAYYDSLKSVKEESYKTFKQTYQVSKEFDFFFTNELLYENAQSRLYYWSIYRHYIDKNIPPLSDAYYDFLKEVSIQADSLLTIPNYKSFLMEYLKNKYSKLYQHTKSPVSYPEVTHQLCSIIFKDKVLEYVYFETLIETMEYFDWTLAKQYYEEFTKKYPESEYLPTLKTKYDKKLALSPGMSAPKFTYKDLEGKLVSLDDFKGKVVYIDVWASWCGPCIAELPSAKKLKEHFKDEENIVFLYVSLDAEEESWRKMIEQKQIEGIHILSPHFGSKAPEAMAQLYAINGIPHYILIDKNGKIVNSNAPRPSNAEINTLLETTLKVSE